MKALFAAAAAVAICVLSAPALAARVAPGNTLPEALNGVAPAGGMCRRDDPVPASGGKGSAGMAASAAPDLSCSIGPAELQSLRGRGSERAGYSLRGNTIWTTSRQVRND